MDKDQVQEEEVNEEEEPQEEVEESEEEPSQEQSEAEPQTYNIGGREYTLEELQQIQEKAQNYENLQPEYTRVTQRLSELEKGNNKQDEQDLAPYEREDWVPKDYKELRQAFKQAEERAFKKASEHFEGQKKTETEIKQQVDTFVDTVRKRDPNFDEQDFFDYATRHKIPVNKVEDLYGIYSAYSEVAQPKQRTTTRTRTSKPSVSAETKETPQAQGRTIEERAMSMYESLTNK